MWEKNYQIQTEKEVGNLKVAVFSDSHVGTTFHGKGFAEHMKTIEAQTPDVVLIVGDFVDDDTTKEDMVKCCRSLGEMKTTYGVYYVFGNHDKGYYSPDYCGYSGDDLIRELEKNVLVIFPLMTIENLINITPDNRIYGDEKRDNTNFIVTSGISDWAIKFKTGCKSEYLMVEILADSFIIFLCMSEESSIIYLIKL